MDGGKELLKSIRGNEAKNSSDRKRTDASSAAGRRLCGPRCIVERGSHVYPCALERVRNPPERLYVVGDAGVLTEGLAIVGARKATPYGIACARRFAGRAAACGIVVVSGGARGCDAEAHRAALSAGVPTVVFLGGGADRLYPAEHRGLFQDIIDAGGAVVSEHAWEEPPLPYRFRERNRLIAGLAKATLIVEAGLPSGTFSTADEALRAGRDVLVVPGAITSPHSRGANRLICQGAMPIVDDETFDDALLAVFGVWSQGILRGIGSDDQEGGRGQCDAEGLPSKELGAPLQDDAAHRELFAALRAQPMALEDLNVLARRLIGSEEATPWLLEALSEGECVGRAVRFPDGKWGALR